MAVDELTGDCTSGGRSLTGSRTRAVKTESEVLRNVSQEYIEEGVPVLVPTTYENEDGETVHADAEVMVEPGTRGFVRAFVDKLPSSFKCPLKALSDLPVHQSEQE